MVLERSRSCPPTRPVRVLASQRRMNGQQSTSDADPVGRPIPAEVERHAAMESLGERPVKTQAVSTGPSAGPVDRLAQSRGLLRQHLPLSPAERVVGAITQQ